jgi:hypothetical protein
MSAVIGSNTSLPDLSDELLNLIKDDITLERKLLDTYGDSIPLRYLEILSDSKNSYTRRQVAVHKNTSPELLDKLSGDSSWLVQEAIVSNPNFSSKMVLRILDNERVNPHKDVIIAILKNKNFSSFVYHYIETKWPDLFNTYYR